MVFRKVALGLIAIFVASCAAAPPPPQYSGFLQRYDLFRDGPDGGPDKIWTAPDLNSRAAFTQLLASYDTVLIDPVTVYYADKDAYDGINPTELKKLADLLQAEIETALRSRYTLTTQPTPRTLRVSFALTGVQAPNRFLAATSSVLPVGLGISMISRATTGRHTNVGGASIEIVFSDAATGRSLFAAISQESGEKDLGTITEPYQDAKELFRRWGTDLRRWLQSHNVSG